MKYPQLVSTRAVSAISDWLVTQLEQLGVDASSVYSRLLLSLLHTPLQINALDLAEISDNKIGNFARNKSIIAKGSNGANYRRFSSADTEALKRLAAIDSLLEAVPSDQQLSKIESLVDELSLKLREIEEQNGLEDSVFDIGPSEDNALCNSKLEPSEKKSEAPEDPARRYFNAFPALSDQSKNDYSHKKTSWPQVSANKFALEQQPIDDPSSSSGGAVATKKKTKRRRVTNTTMTSTLSNQLDAKASNAPATAQSKGAINSVKSGRTMNTKATTQKKKSNDMWDTDFDGAWEMGRDLIREFVLKQNNRNRSISECESARCSAFEMNKSNNNPSGVENDNVDGQIAAKECVGKRYTDLNHDEENLMRVAAAATSALFGKNFDMNSYALNTANDSETVSSSSRITDSSLLMSNVEKPAIRSEGYATPDTLASWNEMETNVPRRERDPDAMHFTDIAKGCNIDTGSDCVDSGCDENIYLAAFEAKFDRNVEALWNDCKPDEPKNDTQLNHSFWFDYDNNTADKQLARAPPTSNDQFKRFFQSNQTTSFASSGNDKNPFAATTAQPNSLSSNASSAIGGMNLTSSIWTDNPNNNEDDVSFYANARLWDQMNQSKSMGQKFNFYSVEPAANLQSNTTIVGASNFDIGNYENSSFSKWSDTELPVLPTAQPDAESSPSKKNEEKIRKNLFGNSYFYNYQSSQAMNNSSGQTTAPADTTTAEYSFGQAQNVLKRKVTLVNHSSSSCFKEVEPLPFEAKQELFCMNNTRKYHNVDANEPEDLLTSDRTRFRPIKQTYADGYTFDISDKLDEINYERSKSGMLYHNSEVYREYYVYDEDGNGGSRCEGEINAPAEFTLKYCIRQNDKSCQTDDSAPKPCVLSTSTMPLSLNADANRMRSTSSLSSANSSSSRSHLLYYQGNDLNSPAYEKTYSHDHSFDKLIDMSQDGWGLDENRQCCNNNNNNGHALWEHCDTCTNDMISMPANRLLKDELSADGDEIMSDLKYLIQSISFQSDWEDRDSDSMADCDDDDTEMVKPKVQNANRNLLTDVNKLSEYDDNMSDGNADDLSSNHIYSNVSKLISDLLQPEKAQTLVQAISEKCQGRLLTDDKNGSGGGIIATDPITKKPTNHDTKDVQTATKNETMCNSSASNCANANNNNNNNNNNDNNNNGHVGSLWAYNDNSIWRKELPSAEIDVKQTDEIKAANRLCEQWEHANLQKLWKSATDKDDASNHDITMMADATEPKQSNTEQTINSHTSLDEKCVPARETAQAFIEHSKPEPNTLEKFMNLIKQANAQGQCSRIGSHSQAHNEPFHVHKNLSRYDRKRRHSATSQNYFDQMNCALNNCDTIEHIKKLATKTVDDYDGTNIFDCDATKKPTTTTIITCKYWTACDSFCLTSTLAFNNNNNNNNNNNIVGGDNENMLNCYHNQMQQTSKYHPDLLMDTFNGNDSIMMQPSTFLKQVAAMVSRPLTR